jgi:Tfp pilus assembly protein PilF
MNTRRLLLASLLLVLCVCPPTVAQQAGFTPAVAEYHKRAMLARLKGGNDDVIAVCNQAIANGIQHSMIYAERAKCYEHKRQLDLAIADYTMAIRYETQWLKSTEAEKYGDPLSRLVDYYGERGDASA